MMRITRTVVAVAVLVSALPALAQTFDRPLPDPVAYHVDSDLLSNASGVAQVVHEEIVYLEGAGWMRLYFGDVELGQGSLLRMTSVFDGEVQELDAAALAMWSHTSAYFNGDTVRVELVAGPQTDGNRLVIDQLAWEAAGAVPTGDCGFCGPDERVPSDVTWSSRLLPAGCTASTYTTESCTVSAGHCIGGSMVVQFHVPPSNPNCSLNHPPVSEQFPVTQFSFTNGGVGNDWSALLIGTNTLGEKPFDRYGELRPIAATPPQTGQATTVWGYGVDANCVDNQVQQTSSGQIASVQALTFRHTTDVTFGNSGSGVLRDGQEILGIVTHCPCPTYATRVDHPSFAAACETLCPTTAEPVDAILISANVELWGTLVAGGLPELEQSDNQFFVVDSVAGSEFRNTAMTVVVAQSPATNVSDLSMRLEFGPANASPVFVIVQIFNWDTSAYELLNLSVASTGGDTVLDFDDLSNPNAYVDGTGKIQLRLVETARSSQTPSGFTKLIDQVRLTVVP
jgi:hypothetical protein